MLRKTLFFLALLFAVLSFAPALAHLIELPNKIGLDLEDYFTVQNIYRGWSLLAFVVIPAILLSAALTIVLHGRARLAAAGAFVCQAAAQAVFWIWTWPANRVTLDWTFAPENWEALRRQWEYSHATGAALNFAAVVALLLSILSWREHPA